MYVFLSNTVSDIVSLLGKLSELHNLNWFIQTPETLQRSFLRIVESNHLDSSTLPGSSPRPTFPFVYERRQIIFSNWSRKVESSLGIMQEIRMKVLLSIFSVHKPKDILLKMNEDGWMGKSSQSALNIKILWARPYWWINITTEGTVGEVTRLRY